MQREQTSKTQQQISTWINLSHHGIVWWLLWGSSTRWSENIHYHFMQMWGMVQSKWRHSQPCHWGKKWLCHRLQDKEVLSQADITQLQQQLKDVNKWNHNLVELAKARWYSGICANIHNMGINQLFHRLQDKNVLSLTDIAQLQQQLKDVTKQN